MAIEIRRASEALKKGNTHAKILVWGNSGVGKSWLAASAPNPLIVLTESNGAVSVGHSNPDADVIVIDNIKDLRTICGMAKSGKLNKYDTIVFDSLTECQRLFKDEILGDRDTLKIQDWGLLATRMLKFIRLVRDLPFHIVCTALADKLTDSEGVITMNLPQFEGKKTANEIMQYFSAVGYYFQKSTIVKTSDGDEHKQLVRNLMFENTTKWMVKPCHPLTNVSDPNMTDIISRIISGSNTTEIINKNKTKKNQKVEVTHG